MYRERPVKSPESGTSGTCAADMYELYRGGRSSTPEPMPARIHSVEQLARDELRRELDRAPQAARRRRPSRPTRGLVVERARLVDHRREREVGFERGRAGGRRGGAAARDRRASRSGGRRRGGGAADQVGRWRADPARSQLDVPPTAVRHRRDADMLLDHRRSRALPHGSTSSRGGRAAGARNVRAMSEQHHVVAQPRGRRSGCSST